MFCCLKNGINVCKHVHSTHKVIILVQSILYGDGYLIEQKVAGR